jgi:hypothetical protein
MGRRDGYHPELQFEETEVVFYPLQNLFRNKNALTSVIYCSILDAYSKSYKYESDGCFLNRIVSYSIKYLKLWISFWSIT